MDNEEIKKQAKSIVDSFARELEKVKIEEARVERKEDRRVKTVEEKEDRQEEIMRKDSDFKKLMLKNALKTKEDCIIAEKGAWIE